MEDPIVEIVLDESDFEEEEIIADSLVEDVSGWDYVWLGESEEPIRMPPAVE